MPRIYDENNNPLDFCRDCWPKDEATAKQEYGDGIDYDCSHPDYQGEGYTCDDCGDDLQSRDN